ncbi:meiosis protein SPO22/ZIP4 like-domain-containing protein [Daedaleopsis nitida]|nr:meiosis protein SPO22/ZIP4 like-domain-containing protein [Daedaleopsis nitida]
MSVRPSDPCAHPPLRLSDTIPLPSAALARIKPKLNGKHPDWNSLRSDLLHLSTLAESLSKHRPRAKHEHWPQRADELDREGVALWNASVVQQDVPDDAYRAVCAACAPPFALFLPHTPIRLWMSVRLAGFRLIEAGMEHKPAIESLIHVLKLASKAGASLADVADLDLAAGVLGSAAKYEELLRAAEDPQGDNAQPRARAVILYYSSRMEAAWREGNVGVAEFMLEKVTESDQYLSLLTPSDRRTLAGKLLAIGKEILRSSTQAGPLGDSAKESVKWIQRAFTTIEPLEDAADTGEGALRRSILRTLARAYFLSSSQDPENLTRAEASLQELMESVDTSLDHTSAEYQQLRWMRVAILKRRKAPYLPLLEAFQSIIDHMEFSENSITDILQELRTLGHDHTLVTAIHLHCLQRAFESQNSAGLVYLDRLLLSLIFHCSKADDHARAMQEVESALNLLDSNDYELPKIPTTACLTLLWQFGDRHYQAKRWSEAADWFLAGTHRAFGSMSPISNPKCFRKAALCYIQCGEHAQASAIVRRCSPTDAATHYVALLIATHQGLEDEAVAAVHEMVHASNFNKKMLLLATRLANESGMKQLLLSVLEALLDASTRSGVQVEAEAITLVRCIIRLVLRMMSEPGADLAVFVPMLIRHFSTALSLVTALESKLNTAAGTRDISWLWRTAYNTAVQGCSDWENYEDNISDLFDISRQLLDIYLRFPAVDSETGLHVFLINASFAGAAGRVFASRHRAPTHAAQEADRRQKIAKEIIACKNQIQKVLAMAGALAEEEVQRAHSFLNVLSVFETEIACHLRNWGHIPEVIEDATRTQDVDLGTLEAITDILWVEKECPVEVLFAALEAILHASLDRAVLSVEKFSRWLRAISTILLSRNSTADRTKVIGYVEQAVGVLQEHAAEDDPQAYPMDERHWLVGTTYNTGIECLHASLLDEAKRWFEAATTICRFVPEGKARSEKIARTYTQLLARYTR